MTAGALDRLVAATLYEGYILYPYRPSSVKNQVRWTFGGVHPRAPVALTPEAGRLRSTSPATSMLPRRTA